MKIGFGLYRHMLTPDYLSFARQAGATHVVVHLVDYFGHARSSDQTPDNQPVGGADGWGPAGDPDQLWELDELLEIREQIERAGLVRYAIENFDPAHWYDVLLGGPKRDKQLENLGEMIRRVGQAGIPVIGYNFSLAGISGRITGPFARGGATSVGLHGHVDQTPIPNGMVWNMVYDPDATGVLDPVPPEVLWRRLEYFLDAMLPVAESAGVRLAAHPDDPPVETVRGQPRLLYRKTDYQRLIDCNPSPANALEFCLGTLAEMSDGNLYDAVETYCAQDRVAYVHCRNVRGRAPNYEETFIDEGDVDFLRVMTILAEHDFDGVVIPDHAPSMTCDAPWHAGMAFTMGFLSAAMSVAGAEASATPARE